MPQYKVTHIFNAGRQGWSESWYFTRTSPYTAIEAAGAGDCQRRRDLMSPTISLEAVRLTNLDDGSVDLYTLETPGGNAGEAADVTGVAALLRVATSSGAVRSFWLRGLPDNWVRDFSIPARSSVTVPAEAAITEWTRQAMKDPGRYQLKILPKKGAASGYIPVEPLGKPRRQAGNGYWTAIPCNLPPGDIAPKTVFSIAKYRGKDASKLNSKSRHKVVTTEADAIVVDIPWTYLSDPSSNFGGVGALRRYVYEDIVQMEVVRGGIRQTGRAFFVRAGKSKRRT